MIWFCLSIAVFFAGVVLYRKGVERRADIVCEAVATDSDVSRAAQADEAVRAKEFIQESLSKSEQLAQDKDVQIHQLEEDLYSKDLQQRELLAAKDDTINLLRVEQEKLVRQLAEEKKYSAQSVDDYRGQVRNLDQMLTQLKVDHQVVLREKEIAVNQLINERDDVAAQHEDVLRKLADLELKWQEAVATLQALKSGSADQLATGDGDLKSSLQKSVVLVKELNIDNERLVQINKDLQEKLSRTELANQNLEEKRQSLQYELVKNRAQLSGLEQICDDLKKKIEGSTATQKS